MLDKQIYIKKYIYTLYTFYIHSIYILHTLDSCFEVCVIGVCWMNVKCM